MTLGAAGLDMSKKKVVTYVDHNRSYEREKRVLVVP